MTGLRVVKLALWVVGVALVWPQAANAYEGWSGMVDGYNHSVTSYNERRAVQEEYYGGLLVELNGGPEIGDAEEARLEGQIEALNVDIAANTGEVLGE